MNNKLAQFYQNMRSGEDKFTLSSGRYFSIIFSFPNNSLGSGLIGSLGNFALNKLDKFGLGSSQLLQTGVALISKEIGLNANYIARYPQDDIHWLVKGINLPNMKIADGNSASINSDAQSFSSWTCPGMGSVEPESDTFSIDLLSTVESPIEGFFHPWMEEVMSMNSGINVPFRRANVFIHVYNENNYGSNSMIGKIGNIIDEANIKYTYKLSGVYPTFVDTPNLSHEATMDNRSVGFKFNKIELFGNPLLSGAKWTTSGSKFLSPARKAIDKVRILT